MKKRTMDQGDSEAESQDQSERSTPPPKKAKKVSNKGRESAKEKRSSKDEKSTPGEAGNNTCHYSHNIDTYGYVLTNSAGDNYIDLGKKKRVTVRRFKGTTYVDIREFYESEGVAKPGKKGISLTAEQWEELQNNLSTINDLVEHAK